MTMKKQAKKLSLNEAAKRMAKVTQEYLDRLPPTERERRLKAFQAVVAETAARLSKDPSGTAAKPGRVLRTQASPVLARARG